MSLLGRALESRTMQFSSLANPATWLLDALGGGRASSGQLVNPTTVKGIPAAFAAIRAISEDVASLPLITYRRSPKGLSDRADNHPAYQLLHDSPNPRQTAMQFREMLIAHALLRGNGRARIYRNGAGNLEALVPLHPDRTQVLLAPDDTVWYKVYSRLGVDPPETLSSDEVLDVSGPSDDGYVGQSAIDLFRDAFGLAIATEDFASRFFANDGAPGGILSHPAKLSKEAYDRLKSSWEARHRGSSNAFRVAILEGDMKWTSVGFQQKDAQFLEGRQFTIEEICRIFRVPPHILQHLQNVNNATAEQLGLEYVMLTIRPWLVRFEQAAQMKLFTDAERKNGYYIEHKVDGLLRGDAMSRNQALAIQRQNGVLSANEWRALENRNPLPGEEGDTYLVPLNYVTTDQLGKTPPPSRQPPGQPVPAGSGIPNDGGRKSLRRVGMLAIGDAIARVERRRGTGGDKGLAEYAERALEPALHAYAAGLADLHSVPVPKLDAVRASLVARYVAGELRVEEGALLEAALTTIEALTTAALAA